MNVAGIDISHKEVVIVISVKGKTRKAKTFENTALGHQAIIHLLSKLKAMSSLIMEFSFHLTVK